MKFVELIQGTFISGKAHLTNTAGEKPDDPAKWGWKYAGMGEYQPQGVCIGAVNGDEVYLLPDASYKLALDSGAGTDRLRATQGSLQKRLREEGLLARTTVAPDPQNARNTVKVRIRGSRSNVLCFRASTFEGAEEDSEQWPQEFAEVSVV